MTTSDSRPIVAITGATGTLGGSLASALGREFRIVGLDRSAVASELPAGGGGGGEYPLQDGFGWTNGVTRAWVQQGETPAG